MALLAWWSAPEAKLITKFNKNYTQSHFVHMLQTLPVSSNSEVLIMFPEEFDINSWIIEVSMIYRRKKLRFLIYISMNKMPSYKRTGKTKGQNQ